MKYWLIYFLLFTAGLQAQTLQDTLVGKAGYGGNNLPTEVQKAFNLMKAEAAKEGINLNIVSGYRSYKRQEHIWNRKFEKYQSQGLDTDAIFNEIVKYSTVPGTSRHHWGTDLDLIDASARFTGDALVPSNYENNRPFGKMKKWMDQHASKYGFALVYTEDSNRRGFNYEPWHWSYVPLSRKRYQQYASQIDLKKFLRKQSITGMNQISDERIERYLKEHLGGINPELKSK